MLQTIPLFLSVQKDSLVSQFSTLPALFTCTFDLIEHITAGQEDKYRKYDAADRKWKGA